ncbi:MAG: DUF1573 domain-containing protein [Deltaproteobacteria bacterium]|nr:DUF1573 domain-containing protein [Deltaproteobacteria bacterium]MBW1952862.1 DUF1573 domain-containing protein [Deltaproteobacteria bacterium]MBW1985860.1 DUF1573 domain-containing protein [Deltaproteobacteria bacterium]MBW2133620.1 DUF1573 domain-containing protein [Deltaproteobacteria bacterium]
MPLLRIFSPRSTFLRVISGICWAGWIITASPAAANPGPQIVLSETRFNIGEVYEDQPLSHTYEFKNAGDETLVIKHIEPDCACTTTDYDKRLPPGEVGKITLTIEPYSVIHQFCKKAEVFSNDPQRPVVVIELCGHAKPFIEIQPGHIIRFRGNVEEPQTARIRLISNLLTPLELIGYQTDIPDKINVAIEAENPGKSFVIQVSNKYRQIGRYKGKIIITTSSDKRPRLILRVFADLYPSSAKTP